MELRDLYEHIAQGSKDLENLRTLDTSPNFSKEPQIS